MIGKSLSVPIGMEKQTVELGEWKDEFLKEIAGFANADGGIILIGVDDNGKPIGVNDPKSTMKKISDTVANKLALYPSIQVDEENNVISITVEKSEIPVDLDGRFYVRSGNTVHEAKGREYDRIVSKRLNISWIDQPVEGIDESDLDAKALEYFVKRAMVAERISETSLSKPTGELLTKLGLKVGNSVTRAGVLLFHPAPEDIITCSFSKIGMFDGSEILYQDLIGGPLVTRLDRILEVMSTKYLIRPITYEGMTRIDNWPYPYDSLRECLLNALIHNDYSSFNPVQIRMWENRMMISDSGGLPEGWTLERLICEHKSEPPNPHIAYTFFIMGFIENWGRGIERIIDGYSGQIERKVRFDATRSYFEVKLDAVITLEDVHPKTPVPQKRMESDKETLLLEYLDHQTGHSINEILEMLGRTSKASVSREFIRPLLSKQFIEYTIPDKPTSRNQRYRTTENGRRYLSERKG